MKVVTKQERVAAFEKVFGGVNGKATKRVSAENPRQGETYQTMRLGKTATDKRKGHKAYQKNIRIFEKFSGKNAKGMGITGEWVKVNA